MAFNLEEVDVDGAVREGAEEASGDTRLGFLKKGALAGGAALSSSAVIAALATGSASAKTPADRQPPPASMFGSGDIGVLNYALTLEYLESSFYNAAKKAGVAKGDKQLTQFLTTVVTDENAHVKLLKGALGSKAAKEPKFDFGKAVSDKKTFVATAYALENTGVHAYHGQLTNIKTVAYLLVAAEIATVEGRHAGAIGLYSGEAIASSGPLDTPYGASKVLGIVKSTKFIPALG